MPISESLIQNYLDQVGFKESSTSYITLCPACQHPNRRCYIDKEAGTFMCFHCEFRDPNAFGSIPEDIPMQSTESKNIIPLTMKYVTRCVENLNDSAYRSLVYNYLIHQRNLTADTISKFQLGYDDMENAISIPNIYNDEVISLTLRYLNPEVQRYRTYGSKGLFNLSQLSMDSKSCVLFEGEIDAITSMQLIPDLPAYATQGKSIKKEEILEEHLAKYEKIFICFDKGTDREVEKLAQTLGKHRCWKVKLPEYVKDLNELAAKSEALELYRECLQVAQVMAKPLIVPIQDKIDACISYFENEKYASKSTGWEALDSITGGIRPGELYVLTGDSGVGKSTLSVAIAYNLAKAGLRTTICSLELPIESHIAPKLVSYLLERNIEIPPRVDSNTYRQALQWLASKGYINFVDRTGSQPKSELKNIIEQAYKLGYNCIILDHLQFLVTKEENDEINEVVRILVDFLKEHLDFTIFLVAHARKPIKDFKTGYHKPLEMYDLKGSASLYQEPDNVWILNKDPENNIVNLKVGKLRSDKTSITSGGKVVLYFNKEKFRYDMVPA